MDGTCGMKTGSNKLRAKGRGWKSCIVVHRWYNKGIRNWKT
jgi:hypothetical protein